MLKFSNPFKKENRPRLFAFLKKFGIGLSIAFNFVFILLLILGFATPTAKLASASEDDTYSIPSVNDILGESEIYTSPLNLSGSVSGEPFGDYSNLIDLVNSNPSPSSDLFEFNFYLGAYSDGNFALPSDRLWFSPNPRGSASELAFLVHVVFVSGSSTASPYYPFEVSIADGQSYVGFRFYVKCVSILPNVASMSFLLSNFEGFLDWGSSFSSINFSFPQSGSLLMVDKTYSDDSFFFPIVPYSVLPSGDLAGILSYLPSSLSFPSLTTYTRCNLLYSNFNVILSDYGNGMFSSGYYEGHEAGYSSGFNDGRVASTPITSFSAVLANGFNAVSSVLNLDIFGLSLGTWFMLPVVILLILRVIALFNNGG